MLKILVIVAGLIVCWAQAPAQDLASVRFVTDWKAEAAHGGYYQAFATGIYARHGLEVDIIQGGPSVNVPLLLGAGQADFAIGSNSFIALNIVAAGIPATAVAAIFQKDPQVLMTHPRDDIATIADMRGEPIMISDAAIGTYWGWLKTRFGFEDRQIRKYTHNLAPFITDRRAIQQGFITSEPYEIEKASGMRPKVFLLADQDYPSYGNLILAANHHITERPKLVRAFVAASIEGWRDYLNGDPTPAHTLIQAENPDMTDDTLEYGVSSMRALEIATAGDAGTRGIGIMTEARWRRFFEVMSRSGLYPRDLQWDKAFTLELLP